MPINGQSLCEINWAVHHNDLAIQCRKVPHWANEGWSEDIEPPGMINHLDSVLGQTLVRPTVLNCDTGHVDIAIDGPFVTDVIADSYVICFRNGESVHQPCNLRKRVAGC
ncbi:hypothetical protein CDAR_608401 [Caerostris darwini]|uniref:Galectin n=1 Tax=Caerostris darwini TaxID=1538125 RepID=A0AAV4U615_9ARAC|nr:hypothetical protein CDAR_608401 [Caerostris darwini]